MKKYSFISDSLTFEDILTDQDVIGENADEENEVCENLELLMGRLLIELCKADSSFRKTNLNTPKKSIGVENFLLENSDAEEIALENDYIELNPQTYAAKDRFIHEDDNTEYILVVLGKNKYATLIDPDDGEEWAHGLNILNYSEITEKEFDIIAGGTPESFTLIENEDE